jgi:hypothetical protein
MGQTRSFGDVRSMSALPESGHGEALAVKADKFGDLRGATGERGPQGPVVAFAN